MQRRWAHEGKPGPQMLLEDIDLVPLYGVQVVIQCQQNLRVDGGSDTGKEGLSALPRPHRPQARHIPHTRKDPNMAMEDRKCQMSWSSKKSRRMQSRLCSLDSAGVFWRGTEAAAYCVCSAGTSSAPTSNPLHGTPLSLAGEHPVLAHASLWPSSANNGFSQIPRSLLLPADPPFLYSCGQEAVITVSTQKAREGPEAPTHCLPGTWPCFQITSG